MAPKMKTSRKNPTARAARGPISANLPRTPGLAAELPRAGTDAESGMLTPPSCVAPEAQRPDPDAGKGALTSPSLLTVEVQRADPDATKGAGPSRSWGRRWPTTTKSMALITHSARDTSLVCASTVKPMQANPTDPTNACQPSTSTATRSEKQPSMPTHIAQVRVRPAPHPTPEARAHACDSPGTAELAVQSPRAKSTYPAIPTMSRCHGFPFASTGIATRATRAPARHTAWLNRR